MKRNISTGTAIYEITDGTTTVSLLAPGAGFHIRTLEQAVPEAKDGGVYQNSPLADGKRLVMRFFDNSIDVLSLIVNNLNQDIVIEDEQRLRRLLEKAVDYWTTRNRLDIGPVWIKRRGADETNTSYAIIYSYSAPRTNNPYAQPLFSINPAGEVQLAIEHGFWTNNPPLEGDCVKISNIHSKYLVEQTYSTVAASADDAYVVEVVNTIDVNGTEMIVGRSAMSYPIHIGMRFQLNVPANAIIQTAYLHMVASSTKSGTTMHTRIYGEDVANSAAFSTYANFMGRALTTMYAEWDSIPTWTAGVAYDSVGIENVVQEVLNDNAWVSGNYITLFFRDDTSSDFAERYVASWDHLTYSPPQLYITYIIPGDTDGTPTCLEQVYVANEALDYPITAIYDNAYTALFLSALPWTLFPNPVAAGNYLYIGSDFYNGGPFDSVIWDLSAICTTINGGEWEYWSGAAWSPLLVQDNTEWFSNIGINGWFWKIPSDWAMVKVGSISAWWIRFHVVSVTGAGTPPVQATQIPYSVTCPFIDIDASELQGDIPVLLKARVNNLSDDDDDDPGTPNMEFNKMLIGVRSLARGADFSAYIPLNNFLNPAAGVVTGLTIAHYGSMAAGSMLVGGSTSALYNPAGVDLATSSIRCTISQAVANQYFGKYAMYVRVRQVGGAVGEISVRVRVLLSSVTAYPLLFQSDYVYPEALADNEALYLGMLEIPTDTPIYEMGDLTIIVDLDNTQGAGPGDMYLYDLVLMPADECLINIEGNEVWENGIGYNQSVDHIQFVDSITNPKRKVMAEVRKPNLYTGNETAVTDISIAIYNNEFSVYPNSDQRIWFTVLSNSGYSKRYVVCFEACYSVMLDKQQRYLAMRGTK